MPEIRGAVESDHALLTEMYLSEIEQDQRKAQRFAEGVLRLYTTIRTDAGRIVGTTSWNRRGGVEGGVIELVAIGVSQSHKRKGFGTGLMEAMMASAGESFAAEGYQLRFVYLFMESRNDAARRFYEEIGFERVCDILLIYPHDHASVMARLV